MYNNQIKCFTQTFKSEIVFFDRFCSIYFVEEVHKLFEIDFVVGFNACDFNHGVHLVICYLFSQYFKYFF